MKATIGILHAFIALNAFGGGIYAMAGAKGVPLVWLEGSLFTSYFFPGLFLFLIIGGSCTVAAVAIFSHKGYANRISIYCGLLLIFWILIQVAVIGYVSWLQPAVLTAALLIIILTWLLKTKT